MSLSNNKVISAWKSGQKAKNGRGTLHTDGSWLYSYRVAIGYRTSNGICVLGDYTSPGGSFCSQTTSCHVGRVRRIISKELIWHPAVFEASKSAFAKDQLP
jgi:hypothetical protein